MRLFHGIAVTLALAVFLALPSVVGGANDYTAYVACGYHTSKPPATSCPKGGRIGAFFKSNSADVKFRTCVTFPNGQYLCTRKSTARQGFFYVNRLTVGSKGRLKVRWKVGRAVVASYTIKVT